MTPVRKALGSSQQPPDPHSFGLDISYLASRKCSLGVFKFDYGCGLEMQICIGKHLVKYFFLKAFIKEKYVGPKVEGSWGRVQGRR